MSCRNPRTIHTVGHSTRTIQVFVELLQAHSIDLLVDVRRWPTSKRFPHFAREALINSLTREGIDYTWRGDLGGFRKPSPDSPNTGWLTATFRAYADFMLTAAFGGEKPDGSVVRRGCAVALSPPTARRRVPGKGVGSPAHPGGSLRGAPASTLRQTHRHPNFVSQPLTSTGRLLR